MGFSLQHLELGFRRKEVDSLMKKISDFENSGAKSVYLSGAVQSGKTSLLCIMFKHRFFTWASKVTKIPAYRLPVLFARRAMLLTHEELKDLILAEIREQDQTELIVSVNEVCTVPHLLLDDLASGSEKVGAHVTVKLFQIIDYRWRHGLMTWITSNISREDLKVKFPDYERICGRLFDNKWLLYAEVV